MMIFIIIFFVILVILKRKYSTHNISVEIDNGKKYYVNKTSDKELAKQKAELLHKINKKIKELINLLKQSEYKDDENVKKLFTNWSGYLEELDSLEDPKSFAYNVNKGEQISICLVNKKTNELNQFNEIIYVVLHELAHMMTEDYSHNAEFWEQFAFLVDFSDKHNIYEKIDYSKNPQPFCHASLNSK